jgi:GNAT superfamily N-acetyltransferase
MVELEGPIMGKGIESRKLETPDLYQVIEMIEGLAAHHNKVSGPEFAGIYPVISPEEGLKRMEAIMRKYPAQLVVLEQSGRNLGYCFSYVEQGIGHIDQLFVDDSARGGGLGDVLMHGALAFFEQNSVKLIDIRVVEGNEAERFYERYGFTRRLTVMSRNV